jgi:hypothetical protein
LKTCEIGSRERMSNVQALRIAAVLAYRPKPIGQFQQTSPYERLSRAAIRDAVSAVHPV